MSFYSVALPYLSDAGPYYRALADFPCAAWLDSGGMARYDILTAAPHHLVMTENQGRAADSFVRIRAALGHMAEKCDVPFAGGALGYWSYDLAHTTMAASRLSAGGPLLPLMTVGIYDWALVLDHQERNARLVSYRRYAETDDLLAQILARLRAPKPDCPAEFVVHGDVSSNFTPASYRRAFDTVQAYLQAGDCYQVNLAQRFCANATGDALTAYLALRKSSPAPYSAFLNFPQAQILCASPERFLRVSNGVVETKPIKGTRPRGDDACVDRLLAEGLKNHPKDRAENLMIVDLLRNDLGKCCEPGTVRVPRLFEVESYAQVHHLVSTVQGKLAPQKTALDVLEACFPGGSITGAPKRRAMEIIEQLEPNRRGIYCGVIGYIGFDGRMDSNIAIRTLLYSREQICCWAGGGIVADSDCEAEYQETLDKASAMLQLLQKFGGNLQTG